jgi:hypothetical protein
MAKIVDTIPAGELTLTVEQETLTDSSHVYNVVLYDEDISIPLVNAASALDAVRCANGVAILINAARAGHLANPSASLVKES